MKKKKKKMMMMKKMMLMIKKENVSYGIGILYTLHVKRE